MRREHQSRDRRQDAAADARAARSATTSTTTTLVSILFTATNDLTAEFPATAARAIGLGDVPLICARELDIEHGMPRVIRVLVHCYTEREPTDLHHVYLGGARALRDDLPE